MAIPQTVVGAEYAAGLPGELRSSAPSSVLTYVLNSADASNNVFGRACTVVSEGVAQAGNPAAGVFAGYLSNPKSHANYSETLAASYVAVNGVAVELVTMGDMFCLLPAAAAIGDLIVFDNTTGALETIAPAAALPAGKTFGRAQVVEYAVGANGYGVININPTLTIPVAA